MSNYRINSVNTLSTYFAPKGAGLTAAATNIRQAGTDLNALLMGRDNRAGNAVTAISSTGYLVNGVDIISRFNRINPIFETVISGSVNYSKSIQTPTITTVAPTNAGSATISSSISNAGTYTPASFSIGVPSGYVASNSGSFTINRINIASGTTSYGVIVNIDGIDYELYYINSPLYSSDGTTTVTVTSGIGVICYNTSFGSGSSLSGTWGNTGGYLAEVTVAYITIGRRTDGFQTTYQVSNGSGNYNTVNFTFN